MTFDSGRRAECNRYGRRVRSNIRWGRGLDSNGNACSRSAFHPIAATEQKSQMSGMCKSGHERAPLAGSLSSRLTTTLPLAAEPSCCPVHDRLKIWIVQIQQPESIGHRFYDHHFAVAEI